MSQYEKAHKEYKEKMNNMKQQRAMEMQMAKDAVSSDRKKTYKSRKKKKR